MKSNNKGGGGFGETQGANMELRASLEYYNYYHSQAAGAGLAPPVYDWSAQVHQKKKVASSYSYT